MKRILPLIALVVVVAFLVLLPGKEAERGRRPTPSSPEEGEGAERSGLPEGQGIARTGTAASSKEDGDAYASARRDHRLALALALFDEQRYERAAEALSQCRATSARADVRELAAYFLAQVSFTKGDYTLARAEYRRFLNDHPGSLLADNARAAIAFVDRFAASGGRP